MGLDNPPGLLYRVAGITRHDLVADLRTLVGPAAYVAGGMPVDLSTVFASIVGVKILRAYVTATRARDARHYEVHEAGTDLFSAGKFRVQVFRAPTPAGTNAAPVASGNCIVGCNNNHPNLAAVAFTGTAPTVGLTEVGAVDLSTITMQYEAIGVPL